MVELYTESSASPAWSASRSSPSLAPGELQRSVLDASLAKRELGWEPQHSLDEGLAETWAWISSK